MNNLEFLKNASSPPPRPSQHGLLEARYPWGLELLRGILSFEAPKHHMLLPISTGHGHLASKSRGCAPNPAFSSPLMPPRGQEKMMLAHHLFLRGEMWRPWEACIFARSSLRASLPRRCQEKLKESCVLACKTE